MGNLDMEHPLVVNVGNLALECPLMANLGNLTLECPWWQIWATWPWSAP